jgi:hypothetical protein
MKDRIKWIVVGAGFMVGIQVATSLMLMGLAYVVAHAPGSVEEDQLALAIFGLTLGAFLFGGFIIGRVNEKLCLTDALIAALATLALSVLIHFALPEGSRGQFTGSKWLTDASGQAAFTWLSVLLLLPVLLASTLGAYLGYHMTAPVESFVEKAVAMLGVIGAVGGPLVLLVIGGIGLPWYLLAIGPVSLLACVGVGYWMFAHEPHELEDISIRPEHHQGQRG